MEEGTYHRMCVVSGVAGKTLGCDSGSIALTHAVSLMVVFPAGHISLLKCPLLVKEVYVHIANWLPSITTGHCQLCGQIMIPR